MLLGAIVGVLAVLVYYAFKSLTRSEPKSNVNVKDLEEVFEDEKEEIEDGEIIK